MSGVVPSEAVASRLQELVDIALRGDPDAALRRLVEVQPVTDADRVAMAQQAYILGSWGSGFGPVQDLCARLLDGAQSIGARAQILLQQARALDDEDRRRAFAEACAAFTLMKDPRGQALALAELAIDHTGSAGTTEHRLRFGRQGLALAIETGDPYTIALCAGRAAMAELHAGRAGVVGKWRQAAHLLPGALDATTAEIASLNYLNWALTAVAMGEYAEAMRALDEGRLVIQGPGWPRYFTSVEALVLYRVGRLPESAALAASLLEGPAHRSRLVARVVLAACALERERTPQAGELEAAVDQLRPLTYHLPDLGLAVAARIRRRRSEPLPVPGLVEMLRSRMDTRLRFGWEDLVVALADVDTPAARDLLPELERMWPRGRRARPARDYAEGRCAGPAGFEQLLASAEGFFALPEPVSAARALHAAAAVAPDVRVGNALRRRAVDALQAAGADHSLAEVLRDRTVRRTAGWPHVPVSQRHAPAAGLTERERELAGLLRQGHTAREIAAELGISTGTVRNHVLAIREKFGGVPKHQLVRLLAAQQDLD